VRAAGGRARRPRPLEGTHADDATLLAAHVAGSPDAFATLVARHQDRLWAVALRTVRDPDDAADVLQDALVKAYRAAGGFRGEAAVSTWLHRIVVTTALDLLRRRRPVVVEPDDLPDPVDTVADSDMAMDVEQALAALPPDQRAAVVLVDLQGFGVDEAARVLGCPPGTVKSRCFRGRARLAALLGDYDPGRRNRQPAADVEPSQAPTGREDEP
jgi:RNA polymerase sigma-70 factor (ECF subfamily)